MIEKRVLGGESWEVNSHCGWWIYWNSGKRDLHQETHPEHSRACLPIPTYVGYLFAQPDEQAIMYFYFVRHCVNRCSLMMAAIPY